MTKKVVKWLFWVFILPEKLYFDKKINSGAAKTFGISVFGLPFAANCMPGAKGVVGSRELFVCFFFLALLN